MKNRISPDITAFKENGVWYHANGMRDEARSPKVDVKATLMPAEKVDIKKLLDPKLSVQSNSTI